MSVSPSPVAAYVDTAQALLPVQPTSRRAFDRTDTVSGFVRVYQAIGRAPGPATLTVAITDGGGKIADRTASSLGPERFATRQADCSFTVPVANLTPGEYLLTVEAAQGAKTVTRRLRFSVK